MSVTTTPPPAPPAPPTSGASSRTPPPEPPPEPPRGRLVWRVVLGCLAVLLCAAVTSAVFWSGEVGTLKRALNLNPTLQVGGGGLTPASFGGPENLLLVGNDQRKRTTTTPVPPHSNEMLLVRFDPGKPYISMMSIPRELMVTIDCPTGPTTTRLNYALTCGGISTLVNTIKQLTGLGINHVVEIDFGQFKRAVNDMGCVYSTVDRRYYHVNVPGGEQYQEINLQPGYQRMCGGDALSFVSYRHGDTSLVRDARDQSFLLDVKRQYGPTLVDNADKFEQIFGRSVETDRGLHTTSGILDLLGTLIGSSSLRVRQVQFQVDLEPTGANPCSCDTATPQQIGASVNAFLHGGSGLPPKKKVAAVASALHAHHAQSLPLVPVSSDELSQAVDAAAAIPFPLEIPRVKDKNGSATPVSIRAYPIQAPDGSQYASYVAVFQAGGPGQYYDVQGTTWKTAPLLDNPDQTIKVGSRTYYLDYAGQHLETVAWYEHGAAYWVRNSLTDALGNGELLAIAEQSVPATDRVGRQLGLRAAVVPQRIVTQPEYNIKNTLGSLGGLVALLALPLLAIPFFHRRRELRKLRAQLAATLHFEAQLRAAAPGGGPAMVQTGWSPPVFTVPRLSRPTRWLAGAGALLLAAVGAAGILVNLQGGTTPRQVTHRLVQTTPSVPVAVLNASSTQGAAGKLAEQLRRRGVKVATVGNLNGSLPPGLLILYAPGYRSEAAALAHVMAAQKPTIQPIDPAAQAAAGSKSALALVIA